MNPQEPLPSSKQDEVIKGHHYDGIREYDNPMPGWWVWLFWASFIFAIIYAPGVHFFGFIDTYEDDLAESQAELQSVREAFATAQPATAIDESALLAFAEDPSAIEAGQSLFSVNCMPCHGADGGGTIGPNLTDAYWIHGNSLMDMYEVVTQGVIEKGMTPWEAILTTDQRAQVVAFVNSLVGTTPASPKAPQGELVES